jgi:hypothetical protein
MSRDEYFFEGPKNPISTFFPALMVFYNIWLPFLRRKLKIKFLLSSLKSLTNSENPSSNPFQEACSGFQVAACDSKSFNRKLPVLLKIVPIAGYDMYTGEN